MSRKAEFPYLLSITYSAHPGCCFVASADIRIVTMCFLWKQQRTSLIVKHTCYCWRFSYLWDRIYSPTVQPVETRQVVRVRLEWVD